MASLRLTRLPSGGLLALVSRVGRGRFAVMLWRERLVGIVDGIMSRGLVSVVNSSVFGNSASFKRVVDENEEVVEFRDADYETVLLEGILVRLTVARHLRNSDERRRRQQQRKPHQRSSTTFHDLSWNKFLAQDGHDKDDNNNDGLPQFILPLPDKMAVDDAAYLRAKGALTIPSASLQSALLRAYAEFVHPYMPLLDLDDFLAVVGAGRPRLRRRHRHHPYHGRVSLFLYQAVAFASTAFVDMRHLHEAGFATRKAARKAFFQRTRVSRFFMA
ncbi:hypothetical protein CP533_2631 [Ophiocordyceps camponoti-saundersi (nom. inval.)]|nr:hypothetical protein CP533_2631 [Ophiocordyceps camponoti-saundersi (nom. inval.)]